MSLTLLALTGMFIFGKKKEERKVDEKTERLRSAVTILVMDNGKGLYRILARADPDGDENRIKKILKHDGVLEKPDVIREAWYMKKYVEYDIPVEREILATHYPIIHAFLALALAHHTGVHNDTPGWAVEKIMSALYAQQKDYEAMKREYQEIAKALAYQAMKHGLTTDEEKTAKVMEEALLKTFKIVDKLLPEITEERVRIVGRALHKDTDDPFVVLRNAGIDIEPELEEFRQFLAEIGGKKMEAEPPKAGAKTGHALASPDLSKAKLEVLSVLNGLEFAGFSEEAKARAVEKLSAKIAELSKKELTPDSLQAIGLYAFALEAVKRENFERLREVDDL
ncbi:hypothetical protein E3E37_00120 [Thermococcus sp. ES12]|nr:hypothetical protein [Thermococcus sp. ES12]